jgi:hypothetical protein
LAPASAMSWSSWMVVKRGEVRSAFMLASRPQCARSIWSPSRIVVCVHPFSSSCAFARSAQGVPRHWRGSVKMCVWRAGDGRRNGYWRKRSVSGRRRWTAAAAVAWCVAAVDRRRRMRTVVGKGERCGGGVDLGMAGGREVAGQRVRWRAPRGRSKALRRYTRARRPLCRGGRRRGAPFGRCQDMGAMRAVRGSTANLYWRSVLLNSRPPACSCSWWVAFSQGMFAFVS